MRTGSAAKRGFALALVLSLALGDRGAAAGPALEGIATYTSIGLYWSPPHAPEVAPVRYRARGEHAWREAQPLWHDARTHMIDGKRLAPWRGSIVGLIPGTDYEVAVGSDDRIEVRTWRDRHPVGRRIGLPGHSSETLTIREGGTQDAYVLFSPRSGLAARIDVAGRASHNVLIDAPFVIVRGLQLTGAAEDAIRLGPRAHDVVIEDNDIASWGRVDADGLGADRDAGIGTVVANSQAIRRITIQRNRIHDPRAGSSSWGSVRALYRTDHPVGPSAIFLWNTGGNHVIRMNEISSRSGRLFNDAIGGGENFSMEGAPGRDSDVYGNSIADCADDGIESEGANINVRLWGNRIDRCYAAIAATPTHVGPLYVYRNLALDMRYSPRHPVGTGVFLKLQSKQVGSRIWGGGRAYVLHNTARGAHGKPGAYLGITPFGTSLRNVVSRNNLFDVSQQAIENPTVEADNDFDYDILGGTRSPGRGVAEPHGFVGAAKYADPSTLPGMIAERTPGRDDAERLFNFNDDFVGAGPDRGAQEGGAAPMRFGISR